MVTLTDLQHKFGFTRNEVVVILFLSVSLIAGTGIRYFRDGPAPVPPLLSLYAASDSEFAARSAAPVTEPEEERFQKKPLPDSASIDINTAAAGELVRLPGIGAAFARRIVAYRKAHGPFTCAEDLMNVRGIGAKKFQALRRYVTLR